MSTADEPFDSLPLEDGGDDASAAGGDGDDSGGVLAFEPEPIAEPAPAAAAVAVDAPAAESVGSLALATISLDDPPGPQQTAATALLGGASAPAAGAFTLGTLGSEDTADASAPASASTTAAAAAAAALPAAAAASALAVAQAPSAAAAGPSPAAAAAAASPLHAAAAPDPAAVAALLDEVLGQRPDTVVKIRVGDPQRVEVLRMGVPVGSYLMYPLKVEAEMEDGSLVSGEVDRRSSDFESLHKLLKARHLGLFLPPLPEKAFFESRWSVGSSSAKVRRADLQAYLRTVAAHPGLRPSEELRLFLTHPGDLSSCGRWQQLLAHPTGGSGSETTKGLLAGFGLGGGESSGQVSPTGSSGGGGGSVAAAAAANSGGGGGGLSARMFKMRQSLMGVVTQKQKPPPALSPEELQLRQAKESLRELQAHLGVASSAARSLASHMESLAEDLGSLGRAMGGMARFEEGCAAKGGQYTPSGLAATQRAADLQQVGTSAAHAHAVMRTFAGRTSAALVVLHDYHVLIPEAISALEDRESALAVVDLLRDQLADKEAALARTQAAQLGEQPGSPAAAGLDKKAGQLAAAAIQLQDRLQTAAAHYEVLKVRNLSEITRLDQQRTTDLRDALRHFARVQAQCSSAVTEVWLPTAVGAQMPSIPE